MTVTDGSATSADFAPLTECEEIDGDVTIAYATPALLEHHVLVRTVISAPFLPQGLR